MPVVNFKGTLRLMITHLHYLNTGGIGGITVGCKDGLGSFCEVHIRKHR